jgi:hypothetical protein
MSDNHSGADSISDSSNAHGDAGGGEALMSVGTRELCNQQWANEQCLLDGDSRFVPSDYIAGCSEAECIEVFQALKENTCVKHISLTLGERNSTKRYAFVAAEYVESSKNLQTLDLSAILFGDSTRDDLSFLTCALS